MTSRSETSPPISSSSNCNNNNDNNHNVNPNNNVNERHDSINLSLLFKFIKPFNGNKAELSTFIQNCNSAFTLAQPHQTPHLFLYVVSQLSSNVINELNVNEITEWTELKTQLKRYFGQNKDLTQLHEELETIKQNPQESISDFYKRLEKLKSTIITAERHHADNTELPQSEFNGIKTAIQNAALRRFILHSKSVCGL